MVIARLPLSILAVALTAAPAFAHSGHSDTAGFVHGFTHPFGGADHVLAMIAVGLLAYQIGGRALWLIPTAFVLVMGFGGALGAIHAPVPHVEAMIAVSLVVAGAAIAVGVKAPAVVVAAVIGGFAVFHGHAHGTEMPAAASALGYAAGFMTATALLHVVGIAAGFLMGLLDSARFAIAWPYRVAGCLVAIVGAVSLMQTL